MNPFSCAACRAKDDEIAHLREQNRALVERLVNIVDPAVQARLVQAEALAKRLMAQETEAPSRPEPSVYDSRRMGGVQDPREGFRQAAPEPGTAEAAFRAHEARFRDAG